MADATMLARRQVRLAVVAALKGFPTLANVVIQSPGAVPTPPENLPAILVRCSREHKESINRGMPEFTSTVTIEVEARLSASNGVDAQDMIEALGYQVEQAILTNQPLIAIVQQVMAIDTDLEITTEARDVIAGYRASFHFELPEMFDPAVSIDFPPLGGMGLHLDLINVFDPLGTYPGSPFPASVVPAPRSYGPDGRDEGAADLPLTP
jgi:hypothetical protein